MKNEQKGECLHRRRLLAFCHGKDQMKPHRSAYNITRALIIVLGASFATVATGICEEASPVAKVRYRMPSIVMSAHADWPKDPDYR
ncbi:MAG: hypothetical protein QGI77_09040, partial [Roseibacillus sp.]|nr:hypothetical protein [Roseibacillus sp.]